MQPTEGLSVPRRALDVEDYIDLARRHKGWIFGPFLFTLVSSVVGVYLWPDSYVSTGVIKIVPQQVPQNMVQSSVNQEMTDRINSMAQTIESRTTLTSIINTFGLYQRERSRMPIEDVIEEMKRKIEILPVATVGGPGRQVPAFAVRFSYENRYLSQRVVQDLVSKFIDEHTRNRSDQSFQSTQFFKDEVEQARKELDDTENKLTTFRVQNNGRLPDQVDANMRQLQALEAQSTYVQTAMARANQDKLQLETNLRIFKDQLAELNKQPAEVAETQQKSQRLMEAERDVEGLKNILTALRQRYTNTNPDVQYNEALLAAAEKKREALLKEEADTKKETPVARPVNQQNVRDARDLLAASQRVASQIEAKDLEVQEAVRELKHLNEQIKAYQGRIETIPLGEKEYGDLLRERDLLKDKYQHLQENLAKAQIGQEMENRKQGETLEILDPASLPVNPDEPKRPIIISVGAGIGLLLGIVIAGAREMKDTSLKNLKDVRAYTNLAVLSSIPLLENALLVRRKRRLFWLAWTSAVIVGTIAMAGSMYYYYFGRV